MADDLAKLPSPMREAMEREAERDPIWTADMLRRYLEADEEGRAGIEAFFESDGPRIVREVVQEHRDGTPTSADLEKWWGGR